MSESGRTERITLWLWLDPMPDPANPSTWTISGHPLTSAEIDTLMTFTIADTRDALALMELHRELADP